mmetsp:Transcript_36702/g.117919  ORF Transcript_36702/g.117919 Transcript_36702/m.117919 type:complete len:287 (-) Transcript_36702:335-1195(-)
MEEAIRLDPSQWPSEAPEPPPSSPRASSPRLGLSRPPALSSRWRAEMALQVPRRQRSGDEGPHLWCCCARPVTAGEHPPRARMAGRPNVPPGPGPMSRRASLRQERGAERGMTRRTGAGHPRSSALLTLPEQTRRTAPCTQPGTACRAHGASSHATTGWTRSFSLRAAGRCPTASHRPPHRRGAMAVRRPSPSIWACVENSMHPREQACRGTRCCLAHCTPSLSALIGARCSHCSGRLAAASPRCCSRCSASFTGRAAFLSHTRHPRHSVRRRLSRLHRAQGRTVL